MWETVTPVLAAFGGALLTFLFRRSHDATEREHVERAAALAHRREALNTLVDKLVRYRQTVLVREREAARGASDLASHREQVREARVAARVAFYQLQLLGSTETLVGPVTAFFQEVKALGDDSYVNEELEGLEGRGDHVRSRLEEIVKTARSELATTKEGRDAR